MKAFGLAAFACAAFLVAPAAAQEKFAVEGSNTGSNKVDGRAVWTPK